MNRSLPPPAHDELLGYFARELRARLGEHLKELVLYGSRARGDHAPDSDYDCLAIVDAVDPDLRETIYQVTGDLLFDHDAVFSVIPVAEAEYRRRVYNPLFMNARKEGIRL